MGNILLRINITHIYNTDPCKSTIDSDDVYEGKEEDHSTYFLEITIMTGKILHSGPNMHMEEEINNEKELNLDLRLAHEKVVGDISTNEVDNKNKVEAPIPLPRLLIPLPPLPQQSMKKHDDKRMAKYLVMLR
ncbi:hypothetical protein HAX54_021337 [Datura stramonium]|uniref:Uncharacterized protein n=1 Tax=Datura stramonium TaxID=4076 RepID=A0ABS8UUX0_DATST|nr:hypothetical protein [Datura stramonium]